MAHFHCGVTKGRLKRFRFFDGKDFEEAGRREVLLLVIILTVFLLLCITHKFVTVTPEILCEHALFSSQLKWSLSVLSRRN